MLDFIYPGDDDVRIRGQLKLTRQVLVCNIKELVDEFYPPNIHLRMGQFMWPAVDENTDGATCPTLSPRCAMSTI